MLYPKRLFHFMFTRLSHLNMLLKLNDTFILKVDASYDGSFLWWNNFFSLGTLYSNACGDYIYIYIYILELGFKLKTSLWKKLCGCLLIKNSVVNNNEFLKSNNMNWSFDWNITKWKIYIDSHTEFVIGTQYIM